MRDVIEKYIELPRSFPNKAGEVLRIITTQKRLVEIMMKKKQPNEVKELLVSVAEGYTVISDFLSYTHNLVQGMAQDADALFPGASIRNIVKMQGEEILLRMNGEQHAIDGLREMIKRIKDGQKLS